MDHGGGAGAVLTQRRTVEETGSTNADLVLLAKAGAAEGFWLRAERQTAGRGRQGRTWVSPTGNFYASTLVRLRASDPPAATLALVAAVALWEAVSVFNHASPLSFKRSVSAPSPGRGALMLKWPNDLLLGGAKLSGILLDRVDDAVIVGVGVNLADHPHLPDRVATSLAAHGVNVDPAAFLDVLAEAFARWIDRWRGEGVAVVRAHWLERAYPVGTALTAQLADGTAVEGLIDGLEPDGALTLRLASGERRVIHAGDIFLL